jgi:hypothetical protein
MWVVRPQDLSAFNEFGLHSFKQIEHISPLRLDVRISAARGFSHGTPPSTSLGDEIDEGICRMIRRHFVKPSARLTMAQNPSPSGGQGWPSGKSSAMSWMM